jgi:cell division protein FtsW
MLAFTRTKPEERLVTGIPSYKSAVVAAAE